LEVLADPLKKWGRDRLLYATIFTRVLDIIRIKIRHLKGENKWESFGTLDSNGLDRLKGSNCCSNERINYSRKEYCIFLKEVSPNAGTDKWGIYFGLWSSWGFL